MLRPLLIVGLILSLLATAVFVPRMLGTAGQDEGAAATAECDLLKDVCTWSDQAGQWAVELEILSEESEGARYQLVVDAPAPPERFLAVLRGESMYMGEYPVPLRRRVDGSYLARFTAPVCTTGEDMRWRIDLQRGQALLEDIPVKMIFQAHSS